LLVTDEQQLFHRAFSSHDMGMIRVNGRLAMPGPEAIAWGAGRRMAELCGAVAVVQMQKLDGIVNAMRGSKRRIQQMLQGVPGLSFPQGSDPEGQAGAFLLMQLENETAAASLVAQMKAAGLHNAVHVSDYGLHIYYRIPALVNKVPLSSAGNPWALAENRNGVYSYQPGTCPKSDELFARSAVLPIPSRLTAAHEEAAATIIRQALLKGMKVPQPHYLPTRSEPDVLASAK
jgi:dTDP-4-amino-4,6-dideoxygalactose transaminase